MSTRDRWTFRLLVTLGVASLLAFYGWWLRPEHYPQNFSGAAHAFDVLIFATLTAVMSHRVFMDVYAWVVARRIEPLTEAPEPAPGLRVAFITTFVPGAEGLDLLYRTLPAMLRADYPHDVWLLDEGADATARQLCESLGVHYFTRHGRPEYNWPAGSFTRRTKGGNHNAWYDAHGHTYDVVAQIDTDFLPRRDFLTQTLGYFRDETVAWVVTPQIYGNTDKFVARGAAQQQFTFYGPVLRGLSSRGMANLLGANHVIRVEALKTIGYYAGHITEDLLTGMRLHSAGWRSVYVPLPLAVGEGPETWKAYLNQQRRWAYGCIDVLVHHTRALTGRMPRSWRWLYLALQQGYFSGIAGVVGIGLLCLYFFGGLEISSMSLLTFVMWGAPFFVLRHTIRLWLQKFSVRPEAESGLMLSGGLVAIAAWPVYFAALVRVVRQLDLTFAVTPKGAVRQRRERNRSPFTAHLVLAVLCAACLACAVAYTDRRSGVLLAWALVNLLLLGLLWTAPRLLERMRVLSRRLDPAIAVLATIPAQSRAAISVAGGVLTDAANPATELGQVIALPRQRTAETVTVDEGESAV